jgi:hypothetical protein
MTAHYNPVRPESGIAHLVNDWIVPTYTGGHCANKGILSALNTSGMVNIAPSGYLIFHAVSPG